MPNQLSQRKINQRIDSLKHSMTDLYSSIYSTRPDNKNDLNRISSDIENNLDDILSSVNNQNISDISSIIMRLQKRDGSYVSQLNSTLEQLTSDNSIIDNINMENIQKYIQAENYQYDLILKYVPKLYQALEIMKDNVLSSDNFTKDFINVIGNKADEAKENLFNDRAKRLMDKYEFQELAEEMYMETSIYGEYFLYIVPYKAAFERLMKRKSGIQNENGRIVPCTESSVLFEAKNFRNSFKDNKDVNGIKFADALVKSKSQVKLEMDMSGIIPEAISEIETAQKAAKKHTSLYETFNEAMLREESGDNGSNEYHRGTARLKNYNTTLAMSHDGMFGPIGAQGNKYNEKIRDMAGCVVYKIPRENIIPLYIGKVCIGYYYFRLTNDYISRQVVTANTFNSLTTNNRAVEDEFEKQTDALVSQIATQLSDAIDAKFINANIDLKEQIYAILRYSDQFDIANGVNEIHVNFIAADDIHHFYFDMDKKTHRGISDLKKSVVPAMLYALLYLTDVINKVSRSQDKRIYYVKQNVETNIARTMLNVITQLKRGNMGMRQLENMNTIFNVIGKYNDHIVPMSQSGDTPIQFEVMQGHQVETPTELMDRQEENAVNSTDVPYEFVQSVNQVDYATRFTMSNSKFLRKVFKRQFKCQKHYTEIFRKLYNYEYNENETAIEILLPAPAFLTMTNSEQLINGIKNYATALVDLEIVDDEDLKPELIRLLVRNYLGSYVDLDVLAKLKAQAKHNLNIRASENESISDQLGEDEDEY